jgi:hypothetical protein
VICSADYTLSEKLTEIGKAFSASYKQSKKWSNISLSTIRFF